MAIPLYTNSSIHAILRPVIATPVSIRSLVKSALVAALALFHTRQVQSYTRPDRKMWTCVVILALHPTMKQTVEHLTCC
ncbi:MAG TPA: hypothetical protein VFE24_07810 [Pirellulales bacterium]|jgi:hypothetical protein|nr:hypothetical protein [Pirellulales bacterium]